MKPKSKGIEKDYLLFLASLALSIFFLLLDHIGSSQILRTGISFVMEPISYSASNAGKDLRGYFDTFTQFAKFKSEYNDLKVAYLKEVIENDSYVTLKEENDSLRKQISLGNKEKKYVLAKVLSGKEVDTLRINEGTKSGVAVGDIVVLGNLYIGTIVRADYEGSLVKLGSNSSSHLEVAVLRSEESADFESKVLTKGVASGSSEGIKIENMSMYADLKSGDTVFVNDSKVGDYLILGYLVGLSENPADTSRSGFVSPAADYGSLVTVFVRTE
jgi:cell shape-determining protein MreC